MCSASENASKYAEDTTTYDKPTTTYKTTRR